MGIRRLDHVEHAKNDTRQKEASSLVKPHLLRLSGSSKALSGLVVERVIEAANSADLHLRRGPSAHVVVIPCRKAARLNWKSDGNSRSSLFAPGEMLINPQGNFVGPSWEQETEFFLLGLDAVYLKKWAEEHEWPSAEMVPVFHFRDELLRNLVTTLAEEFEKGTVPDIFYAETLAHTLTTHVLRKYSVLGAVPVPVRGGLPRGKLRLSLDYFEEHLANNIRIADVAGYVGLSPSHFITLFRRATGQSPHQYLLTRRIEQAKALLQQTKISISEIALRTGFADQSHLTRMMRRYTGTTPRVLREK